MPEMTPVADKIIPPDQNAGIGRLSSILQLKQQQQNLQTGQYQQEQAQAESKQAQQRSGELQAAQQLVLNGAKSKEFLGPDGKLDRQRMADAITTVAPTYGQTVATQLLSQANEIVANQQAHQSLTMDRKKEIGDTFASLAADPEVDNTKVIDALETLRQVHKDDPEFSRMLTSMAMHVPPSGAPQDLQNLLGRWSAAATGDTQAKPNTVETTTGYQPGMQNRFTGQQTRAPGQEIPKNIGAPGVLKLDQERADQVSAGIQPANSAIRLSTEIDDLAEQINSGKVSKVVSELAASTGLNPMATARQLLAKDLGQLKTLAGSSAGSDARLQTILSGYPDETSNTQTIHTAMDYLRGNFRQQLARGKQLNAYRERHPDLAGFQHRDDLLTSNADPLMHEYLSLPAGQAKVDFFKRNFKSKDDAKAFRNRAQGLSDVIGE